LTTTPSRPWAIVELVLAIAIMYAGLAGYLPFAATPYLLVAAALFLWRRGPGWRAIGLRRPESWPRTLVVALGLGAYQIPSLYFVEPVIARLTNGELPDVSMFRSLVGDERLLLFWLAISWTLAAFMEEMVYRGWLVARIAELARFTPAGWVAAVMATSILFGLAHLYQGASGVVATGLSGLIFGVAYLASGRNLWCAILAHGLMDTIGFVMIYFGVYPGI
jgi:membrane protease YdiL (CAAX protease family)